MKSCKPGILIISILTFLFFNGCSDSSVKIAVLKCTYKENPFGINENPVFSWILESKKRNQSQSAYQIIVSEKEANLKREGTELWNSGKILSGQSIGVAAKGLKLNPGTKYFWRVNIWDKEGKETGWSKPAWFITGLFTEESWESAKWISYEDMPDSLIFVPGIDPWGKKVKHLAKRRPVVPLFRTEFQVEKKVSSAYLFISGLGQYKAYINGKMISDDFMSPGWTHYQKTCLYNTYDVTSELRKGINSIGAIVGNGFHNINNERYRKVLITYGMPKMIAKLQINYNDGNSVVIVSDTTWKSSPSPVTFSSIYGGEDYDARLEQKGWNEPGFNDSSWNNAIIAKHPGGTLASEITYPVKVIETFDSKNTIQLGIDTFMYDFGQNASGIFSLKVKGNKGDTIRLKPGELINEDNSINQNATGKPYYYEYVCKGDRVETWQPLFSYYGFRYIQIEGAHPSEYKKDSKKPVVESLKMLHTFNSAPVTGTFRCSNELFNNINKLIKYAIQSNIQSVATDCPQREKLGWLEQSYLMGPSIKFNFEVYHLFSKVVSDMMDSQRDNGLIGSIAPEFVVFGGDFTDSPEWGSAIVMLSWLIYEWYGDMSVMEKAWPSMKRYVNYLDSKAENNILSHGLGDWYDLGPERPGYAQLTPKASTATAIYYLDCKLLSEMALILGKNEEANAFQNRAEEIKSAYNQLLFDPETNTYASGSQTSMAIPLATGIVDKQYRSQVLSNLVDSIHANNKALTAGDIGFYYLLEALTAAGQSQLIFEMNNRDDVPGYGFQIKNGATALAESWQALKVVSNNHLMLGHIMKWFYDGLGGIKQDENSVAYKKIIIKPAFLNDLNEVKTSFNTFHGTIKSEWKRNNRSIKMNIEIPVNTRAMIYLPTKDKFAVEEQNLRLTDVKDLNIIDIEDDHLIIEIGSGEYEFLIKK